MSLKYDWNDLRLFLALVRSGSVRSAAVSLGLGRATVSRRIRAFEDALDVRLFEGDGWDLTASGETLLQTAEQVELQLSQMERLIVGQDMRLNGSVRLLAPDFLVGKTLMPTLRHMAEAHPGTNTDFSPTIHLEVLTRRSAELAIWLGAQPPEDLIGRRMTPLKMATYRKKNTQEPKAWIGFGRNLPTESWIAKSVRPDYTRRGVFQSVSMQHDAVREGLGIAELPCAFADDDPEIERLPDAVVTSTNSLWLLRHADTRNSARLKYVSDVLFDTLSKLSSP
ncbi:MAG: LysR family transcriptional regulator [Tateyamaria sp.]